MQKLQSLGSLHHSSIRLQNGGSLFWILPRLLEGLGVAEVATTAAAPGAPRSPGGSRK